MCIIKGQALLDPGLVTGYDICEGRDGCLRKM